MAGLSLGLLRRAARVSAVCACLTACGGQAPSTDIATSAGGTGVTAGASGASAEATAGQGGRQDFAQAGTSGAGAATGGGSGASAAGGADAGLGGAAQAGSGGDANAGGVAGAGASPGCGASSPPASGRYTISVAGTDREYELSVPASYDGSQAHRLIFAWHWRDSSAKAVILGELADGPYYGLEPRSEGSAIFVAPEGLDKGWANTNGRDIAFLRAMIAHFQESLCIDPERLFSVGFSFGGMMVNAIGCEMGDVFRAIAPMAGALYSGCTEVNRHPLAVWMAHGASDDVVPVGDGRAALELFLERNQCGTQTTPVSPNPCVSYSGCAAGAPVHYCEWDGEHITPSFAPDAIWSFFEQL